MSKRANQTRSAVVDNDLSFRAAPLEVDKLDEQARSVPMVLATETPTLVFDPVRKEPVIEVLRADGAEWPKQVPLLDHHDRSSIERMYGSARDIHRQGREIHGRVVLAASATKTLEMVRDGHLTDVSPGYRVLESRYVPRGQQWTYRGDTYEGPIKVATRWRVKEVSLTPVGADERAKLRRCLSDWLWCRHDSEKGTTAVDEELKALLEKLGLRSDASDEDTKKFLLDELAKRGDVDRTPADGKKLADDQKRSGELHDEIRSLREELRNTLEEATNRDQKRAAFVSEVSELANLADLTEQETRGLLELTDLAAVRKAIKEIKANRTTNLGPGPRIVGEGRDRLMGSLETALMQRAMTGISCREEVREEYWPKAKWSPNADDFRALSLRDLARICAEADGYDTRRMDYEDIAYAALGFGDHVGLERRSGFGGGLHTTSSFSKITADVINKSMLMGYAEYPATWRGPMKQGTSVTDFKDVHRIVLSAVPNLPIWGDNQAPHQAKIGDAEEVYAVEAYSLGLSIGYRTIINDDVGEISTMPNRLGVAAGRTVNAVAWAHVTSNPTMRDSVPLFSTVTGSRKRANYVTGTGAPSTSTIQTLSNLMLQQRTENTPEGAEGAGIIGVQPRYLVHPSAMALTVQQLIKSPYDPADANMKYNTAQNLEPVMVPELDASSTVAWYLFADPRMADTVEVTFMSGHEKPKTRNQVDFKTLSREVIVLQTFGVKALDWRGVAKHKGEA